MKSCDRFLFDGFADWEEGREPNAHTATCPDCQSLRRALDGMGASLRRKPAIAPLETGWKERVLAMLPSKDGIRDNAALGVPAAFDFFRRIRRRLNALTYAGHVSRRWLWAAPAAVLIGLSAIVLPRNPVSDGPPEAGKLDSIPKGSSYLLGFSVREGGRHPARIGLDGEELNPGDMVELHLSSQPFPRAHVFSVDGRGRTQFLFDWRSTHRRAGVPTLEVDATPTPDRIVVILHHGYTDIATLEKTIARAIAQGRRLPQLPPGIVVRWILVRKKSGTSSSVDQPVPR